MDTIPVPNMKGYWTQEYVRNISLFRDIFQKKRFFFKYFVCCI